MKRGDENYSERRQAREKAQARNAKESEEAGDPTIPEGQGTETRKNYPKLLRKPYEFDQDASDRESEDIILESGCNSITDEI